MSADPTASACASRAFPDVSGFISMLKDAISKLITALPLLALHQILRSYRVAGIMSRHCIFGHIFFFATCVRFMQYWFELFLLRFSRSQSSNVRGITQSCQNIRPYLEVFMGEQGLIWIPNFIEGLIFTAEWQIVREMLNTNPVSDSSPVICSFYTGNITNSNGNI